MSMESLIEFMYWYGCLNNIIDFITPLTAPIEIQRKSKIHKILNDWNSIFLENSNNIGTKCDFEGLHKSLKVVFFHPFQFQDVVLRPPSVVKGLKRSVMIWCMVCALVKILRKFCPFLQKLRMFLKMVNSSKFEKKGCFSKW